MHRSEWLDQCKHVPVGQSRRVYHGAEGRPNLVLYNNPDSWSAYCHSCKEGGKVMKDMLEPVDTAVPVFHKYLDHKSCVTLRSMSPDKFKQLVMFLHDKGMSTTLVESQNAVYCTSDERLVFKYKGVHLGRDITGRSPAKWLHYHNDNPAEYVYLQGKTVREYEPVIMTEDLFSAIKINYYTGYSAMCCLGTRITDEIVTSFVKFPSSVEGCRVHGQGKIRVGVLAFDGDGAGDRARRDAANRFGLRGVPFVSVSIPRGLDPKDLSAAELIETFKFLENYNE